MREMSTQLTPNSLSILRLGTFLVSPCAFSAQSKLTVGRGGWSISDVIFFKLMSSERLLCNRNQGLVTCQKFLTGLFLMRCYPEITRVECLKKIHPAHAIGANFGAKKINTDKFAADQVPLEMDLNRFC